MKAFWLLILVIVLLAGIVYAAPDPVGIGQLKATFCQLIDCNNARFTALESANATANSAIRNLIADNGSNKLNSTQVNFGNQVFNDGINASNLSLMDAGNIASNIRFSQGRVILGYSGFDAFVAGGAGKGVTLTSNANKNAFHIDTNGTVMIGDYPGLIDNAGGKYKFVLNGSENITGGGNLSIGKGGRLFLNDTDLEAANWNTTQSLALANSSDATLYAQTAAISSANAANDTIYTGRTNGLNTSTGNTFSGVIANVTAINQTIPVLNSSFTTTRSDLNNGINLNSTSIRGDLNNGIILNSSNKLNSTAQNFGNQVFNSNEFRIYSSGLLWIFNQSSSFIGATSDFDINSMFYLANNLNHTDDIYRTSNGSTIAPSASIVNGTTDNIIRSIKYQTYNGTDFITGAEERINETQNTTNTSGFSWGFFTAAQNGSNMSAGNPDSKIRTSIRWFIDPFGNTAIGNYNPLYLFDVNGTLRATTLMGGLGCRNLSDMSGGDLCTNFFANITTVNNTVATQALQIASASANGSANNLSIQTLNGTAALALYNNTRAVLTYENITSVLAMSNATNFTHGGYWQNGSHTCFDFPTLAHCDFMNGTIKVST